MDSHRAALHVSGRESYFDLVLWSENCLNIAKPNVVPERVSLWHSDRLTVKNLDLDLALSLTTPDTDPHTNDHVLSLSSV